MCHQTGDSPVAARVQQPTGAATQRVYDVILAREAGKRPVTPRASAVLVPIVARPEGLSVILIQRPETMAAHAGQISFPGGKVDEHNSPPTDTALREAEEEMGFARTHVEVLGFLDCYQVGSGFRIVPVVGLVEPPFSLSLDTHEVIEAFEVPFAFLMDSSNHEKRSREMKGITQWFYVMPHEDRFILGSDRKHDPQPLRKIDSLSERVRGTAPSSFLNTAIPPLLLHDISGNNMRKTITVHIVNAFVVGGADSAGVVLDADDLSETDKQEVAAAVGVSETGFLSRSKVAAFKLDFFTPNKRIPHCGHATIAAFSYLVSIGLVGDGLSSKETVDGPRGSSFGAAFHTWSNSRRTMMTRSTGLRQNTREQDVIDSLGLKDGLLDKRARPVRVNTGNRFLLVGVESVAVLRSIVPDFEAITTVSERLNLVGYYAYTTEGVSAGRDASDRMFAPRYAIREEAATGMAAGTLGCLL